MSSRIVFVFVVSLLLAACRTNAGDPDAGSVTPTPASSTVTIPAGSPTAAPEAPTRAEPPPPTPVLDPVLPEPTLFDVAWLDREPFRSGLLDAEQGVLERRSGATIYHLDLQIADDLVSLQAKQEVLFTNTEATALDEVYFRLFPNLADGETTIAELRVNGTVVSPAYELEDSAIRVPMEPPLAPGEAVVIALTFFVAVPTEGGGNYGTFVFDENILALAHFYPLIPVYDREGWNIEIAPESGDVVFSDSSFYLVRITAPDTLVIAASGVETAVREDGGRRTVTYAAAPVRDFYIAASPEFVREQRTVGNTVINSYTLPGYADASALVADFSVAATTIFNDLVGTYPFVELDVVSTPTAALGIEYPGIIAIALRLYDLERGGYSLDVLEGTVAHEVGHQWFYSLVGNDQLDEPWLDESLTQYITLRYFRERYGEPGNEGFQGSLSGRWSYIGFEDIPVGLPVAAYSGAEYSGIVYGRGPLFFVALEETVGSDAMDAFLRDYFATYEWEISRGNDLQNSAEDSCGCDLAPLFEEWVYP